MDKWDWIQKKPIKWIRGNALWDFLKYLAGAFLGGKGVAAVTHVPWLDLFLSLLGIGLMVSVFVRRSSKAFTKPIIPESAPAQFQSTGTSGGMTAVDHWARSGAYDVLIWEGQRLKTMLEDIREADIEKKISAPLGSEVPVTVETTLTIQLLRFRTLYDNFVNVCGRSFRIDTSLTRNGFPTALSSLDVLRGINSHLEYLNQSQKTEMREGWIVARDAISGFGSPQSAQT